MAENVSALAKMLMDESSISGTSLPFSFITSGLKAVRESVDDEGTRGTLSRSKERDTLGLTRVSGQTVHRPSPTELNNMLPWLLGTDESIDTFALADTPQPINIAVLIGSGLANHGMITYAGCVASQWEFSGRSGSQIQLAVDWLGKTRTGAAGSSFPSVALDTDGVYVFVGGVLTVRGSSRRFSEFNLIGNNFGDPSFNNSATADDVDWLDRRITLATNMPYIASHGEAVYDSEVDDTLGDGAAGSLVFNSNRTGQLLTFTFANLKPVSLDDPTIPQKQRIRFPITYKALKSGSTNELIVTHDPVV